MNRIMIICFVVVLVCTNYLGYLNLKESEHKFQEIIDTKEKMYYNKLQEYEAIIQERDDAIESLTDEIYILRREPQVSRGTGRYITCETSAYSCGDGMTPSDTMANGEKVHVGAVACNFLPLGTQIKIDGNTYTVKDRCGIDNCIDIYMDTIDECDNWGRQMKEVEIL